MKHIYLLFTALYLFSSQAQAQNSDPLKVSYLIAGGGHNLQITGNDSGDFIDAFFLHCSKVKRHGYVWKFKNIRVPGISGPLTFQVHQGLTGSRPNGGSYFNTFENEKYKQLRLSQNKSNERKAILIYIKRGRDHVIKNIKDAALVKQYILSLYQ